MGVVRWHYENTFEEAKKYSCRAEFQRGSRGAYKAALKYGWLDKYTWFKKPEAYNKKWTHEACTEEAKKYKSVTEFRRGSNCAYEMSRKYGWLKEFTWLAEGKKPVGHWNYVNCYKEAKKYKSRSEMEKKSPSAYGVAQKNDWLDDYIWMPQRKKVESKWTKEKVFEIARKFKVKSVWERQEKGCYLAALRAGWIKEMDWFEPARIEGFDSFDEPHLVYAYVDEENKRAYVGLTYNIKMRHMRHKISGSVHDYFTSVGKELPEPVILIENVSVEGSRYYEDFYRKRYEEDGYTMLNKGATGPHTGSCGGGRVVYTKEVAYEIAKKCKTLSEFQKTNASCYARARQMNWLKDYTWLKRKNQKYTYEECVEEIGRYANLSNFIENAPDCYKTIVNNNWEDLLWNLTNDSETMTKEECREIALGFSNPTNFKNNYPNVYNLAVSKGWFDEFDWLDTKNKPKGYWTKERIIEVSKQYDNMNDFMHEQSKAYQEILRLKMSDELPWLKKAKVPNGYWTKEKVTEIAKKYTCASDFKKNDKNAYKAALAMKLTDTFTWFIPKCRKPGTWDNKEFVFEKSRECSSMMEFKKKYSGGYKAVVKNGWHEEMTWLKQGVEIHWTEERVLEASKKFKTHGEFRNGDKKAYAAAQRLKLLDKMPWLGDKKPYKLKNE